MSDLIPRDRNRKCGAKKPSGGTCNNPAGFNTDHPGFGPCSWHYGRTPSQVTYAARAQAAALGAPMGLDPWTAITNEISRTAGHVAFLEAKVAAFRLQEPETPGDEPAMTANQEAWWRAYNMERRNLVEVSAIAIKAGLKEREVRLAERQGEIIANAIEQILDRIGLTEEQVARVPEVVPTVLRAITAGQEAG